MLRVVKLSGSYGYTVTPSLAWAHFRLAISPHLFLFHMSCLRLCQGVSSLFGHACISEQDCPDYDNRGIQMPSRSLTDHGVRIFHSVKLRSEFSRFSLARQPSDFFTGMCMIDPSMVLSLDVGGCTKTSDQWTRKLYPGIPVPGLSSQPSKPQLNLVHSFEPEVVIRHHRNPARFIRLHDLHEVCIRIRMGY